MQIYLPPRFPFQSLVVLLLSVGLVDQSSIGQDQAGAVASPNQVAEFDPLAIPATDDGLPGAGPIRRQDWFHNVWNRRRKQFQQDASTKSGAVVFLGDSITQGWGNRLDKFFADMTIANRGISGDTTRGMLIRMQDDVLKLNPSAVVLLMGTNDLEENASPETVADNIELIVAELSANDPKMPVVACGVMPSSETKKRPKDKITAINDRLQKLPMKYPRVTYLDTWTLFAGKNGDAKSEEFPDLLHPNHTGYSKWAAALRPVFATLGFTEKSTTPVELGDDERALFNGQDLTGWEFRASSDKERQQAERMADRKQGAIKMPVFDETQKFDGQTQSSDGRYQVIGGRLVVTSPPEGRRIQQLWTQEKFSGDFTLRVEFRCTPNADSGVFVCGRQLQCRDYPLAGPYNSLERYMPQDWNELTIQVRDRKAKATCNGEVLEVDWEVPERGPIGLEGDRGQVEYRNIRIGE